MAIILTKQAVKLEHVRRVALKNEVVRLSPQSWRDVGQAARFVERLVAEGRVVYGVTTGFGAFANKVIDPHDTALLQENLIVSHACGVGEPFPRGVVRAALFLRIASLRKGRSGIRPTTLKLMLDLLNHQIHPVVPCQGSVGASGDLAPLCHLALPLLGKGQVEVGGTIRNSSDVLREYGLRPVVLASKEGLAINNGTPFTTALATLALLEGQRLLKIANLAAALSLEALAGRRQAFDARLHQVRPHPGQQQIAATIRHLTRNSRLVGIGEEEIPAPLRPAMKKNRVQDAYSLRCIPQIHGATVHAFHHVAEVLTRELDSVTDNPIFFPEDDGTPEGSVLSGGNFHGQPVAMVADYLKLSLCNLGNISERRCAKLVDDAQSDGLPLFLTPNGGINSGLMIPQYTAASLASENKVLVHPASADTIPTSANTEDHVSMGPIAGRQALQIALNVRRILAVEILSACQGINLRLRQLGWQDDALGESTRSAFRYVRQAVPFAETDRDFGGDLRHIDALLAEDDVLTLMGVDL